MKFFSNSYVRALLVNVVFFLAVWLRLMQTFGTHWTPRHTMGISLVATIGCINTLILGTWARRSSSPWSWLKLISLSMACGVAIACLMLVVSKVRGRTQADQGRFTRINCPASEALSAIAL